MSAFSVIPRRIRRRTRPTTELRQQSLESPTHGRAGGGVDMQQDLRDRIAALGDEAGRVLTRVLEPLPAAQKGPLVGLSVSVKDNIDVAGITTAAASQVLLGDAPALEDAPV